MCKIKYAKAIRQLVLVISVLLFLTSPLYSSTVTFYVYDEPEKNVTSISDNTGNTVNAYVYDAFGNIINQSETGSNTYRYNSEQFDSELGLIFLRNRYYDSNIGRFITKDAFSGNRRSSQSFDPYIFVLNNPINYIDPLGLKTVIIHGVDILTTLTGGLIEGVQVGYSGELSRELGVLGEDVTEVNWSGNFFNYQEGYSKAFTAIVSAAFEAKQSGEKLNVIGWSLGSGIAADVLRDTGIKADNFITLGSPYGSGRRIQGNQTNIWSLFDPISYTSGISGMFNPNQYEISGGFPHMNYFSNLVSIDKITQTLGYPSSRINNGSLLEQFLFGSPAYAAESNFGGVSLSKTASLMLNIEDIAGAGYDEATGQVILYGKQDMSLPKMELDDLAVAVRSVYGYGGKAPQDPGVSIGTEPSDVPGQMKVRYDGQTNNTAFGSVMFESDRLLKCLTMGKDNITGDSVGSSVLGYKDMLSRYREAGSASLPSGPTSDRMWFVPREIKLVQSEDAGSMVFDKVAMELLTESKFQDNVYSNPVAESFANHFTAHYDEFAGERPILKVRGTLFNY